MKKGWCKGNAKNDKEKMHFLNRIYFRLHAGEPTHLREDETSKNYEKREGRYEIFYQMVI